MMLASAGILCVALLASGCGGRPKAGKAVDAPKSASVQPRGPVAKGSSMPNGGQSDPAEPPPEPASASHAIASDIPGKAAPPIDAAASQSSERIAIAFKPSARAIRERRVTVGVGERRPRADIFLVCPAPEATPTYPEDPLARRIAAWLGPRPSYRVFAAGDKAIPAELPIGAEWVAVFDTPVDSGARKVAIEGRYYPLTVRSGVDTAAERPVAHAETGTATLALTLLAADSLQHWRASLARPLPIQTSDAVLALLAARRRQDSVAAMGTLDAETGHALRAGMAGVVSLGEGVSLPVWPGDSSLARAAIRDILDAEEAPRRTLIAQAWLQQQPAAGAIILDDAAAVDPRGGLTFPSVLLVNFTGNPVAASASRGTLANAAESDGAGAGTAEMLRIEPLSALIATIGADQSLGMPDEQPARGSGRSRPNRDRRTVADVKIGDWSAQRAVIGELAKCRPPGLGIGPLMADWTQETFLKAALDPTTNAPLPAAVTDRAFAGRLLFESGRWVIYLEIGNPADPKAPAPEIVLHFGPSGASGRGALRIGPDGELLDVRGPAPTPAGKATVVRSKDRVSIWVPVPASAIEAGSMLRLGVVFVDGQGRRSAWPRAMLPWQNEPGRIAIDLGSWGPG